MSRGVNRAIILGTLGQDPEVKATSNGSTVCNLSVATNEEWKDKNTGEKQSRTEWHRIVIFGKLAEIASKYLKKGSQAYFEGKITTRKWQDQSGNDRYSTEIVANELQMLGGRPGDSQDAANRTQSGSDQTQPRDYPEGGGGGFDDGSIPF